MSDTRQNKTVAGDANSTYAHQAGEGPEIELDRDEKMEEPARQDGSPTIKTDTNLEKELSKNEKRN